MPSNAESFVDSYVTSLESYWNREREETKALLVKEEDNRGAYISSLEQSIRSADDDIRNWTNLQGTADRAERRLILERQRLNISRTKARRRGLRSGSVAGVAFDKLEGKFAKAATGKGEKGLNLSQAMSRMGSGSKQDQALALMDILSNETDLAGLIATTKTGRLGGSSIESSVAAGSGIMRTLEERRVRGAGINVDPEVLQMAAAGMVGLWGVGPGAPADQHQLLDPAMAKQLRGAVTQRANAAVSTASSGAEDKALADELERSGFLLEDFLPAMEASGLIQRREDLDRRLAEERAARQPDLEAETERRFLERVGTGGAGEGLEFAGRGIIGAFQFAAQEKNERRALDERRASLTARQGELDAMTPNARLLQRTTGLAMGSYQKHGNNIPPGVSKELWALATQVASQSKAGGFADHDDIVVQTRALVNQLKSLDGVSPEERENALEQTLEFFGMQKMGDYPPPPAPVERVVDEVEAAVEAADPDKKRSGSSTAAKDAAAAKAAKEKAEREKAEAAKAAKDPSRTRASLGLSRRDLEMITQIGRSDYMDVITMKTHQYSATDPSVTNKMKREWKALWDKGKSTSDELYARSQKRLTSMIKDPRYGPEAVKRILSLSEDEKNWWVTLPVSGNSQQNRPNEQATRLSKQAFLSKLLDVVESNAPGEGQNIGKTGLSLARHLSLNPADAAKPVPEVRPLVTPEDIRVADSDPFNTSPDSAYSSSPFPGTDLRRMTREDLQLAALGFPQTSEQEMQLSLDAVFDTEDEAKRAKEQTAREDEILAGFAE